MMQVVIVLTGKIFSGLLSFLPDTGSHSHWYEQEGEGELNKMTSFLIKSNILSFNS